MKHFRRICLHSVDLGCKYVITRCQSATFDIIMIKRNRECKRALTCPNQIEISQNAFHKPCVLRVEYKTLSESIVMKGNTIQIDNLWSDHLVLVVDSSSQVRTHRIFWIILRIGMPCIIHGESHKPFPIPFRRSDQLDKQQVVHSSRTYVDNPSPVRLMQVHNTSRIVRIDIAVSHRVIMCFDDSSTPFVRAQVGVAMSSSNDHQKYWKQRQYLSCCEFMWIQRIRHARQQSASNSDQIIITIHDEEFRSNKGKLTKDNWRSIQYIGPKLFLTKKSQTTVLLVCHHNKCARHRKYCQYLRDITWKMSRRILDAPPPESTQIIHTHSISNGSKSLEMIKVHKSQNWNATVFWSSTG